MNNDSYDAILNSNDRPVDSEMWELIPREEKNAEKIARKSLSYGQDVWRRLRSNHTAILGLLVILIVLLSAIFVPLFWPYNYYEQELSLSNLPPFIPVYPLNETEGVFISPSYEVIKFDLEGNVLGAVASLRKDLIQKKNYYKLPEGTLVVDYGVYTKGLKELKALEQKYNENEQKTFQAAKLSFLEGFVDKNASITLDEARHILNHQVKRMTATLNGELLPETVRLRNKTFLFGTDNLGRDLFIRVIYGARVSLAVGLFAALINLVVGVLYGGLAGYFGGRLDNIMMRIVDIIYSIPMSLYVILIMVIVGPGLKSIIISLGLTYWVGMARLVRGQVLSLKQDEFIKAARVLGADTKRILFKHLVPNMMGPIMVSLSMQIPSAIFTEAFLSFIGLGVSAPQASWGTLANDALSSIYIYPYQMFLPALAISITVLSFNLFSDGLRDALDPKQRK